SVQDDAKVTTAEGKTKIDTKKWTVYLWVVPDTDTVDKAVPKIAKLIEGEVKQFAVDSTEKVTVAGVEGKLLIGKGIEADDSDPATADVVVFAVGNHVLAACVHGEGERGPQWRPHMLEILKTVAKP
ncbi:MAG: hypothetical protein K8T25_22830, partial [Planctomycetia bacterium]|nr:hypothetical protein [Planctomycetia bacterium]